MINSSDKGELTAMKTWIVVWPAPGTASPISSLMHSLLQFKSGCEEQLGHDKRDSAASPSILEGCWP